MASSVWAQIARARGATTAGQSLLEALAKAKQLEEEQRRREEDYRQRVELARMQSEWGLRNATAQTLLKMYSDAAGKGYLSPEEQRNVEAVLGSLFSGQMPTEQIPSAFGEVAGAMYTGAEEERRRKDIEAARSIAAMATQYVRPEEVDAFKADVEELVNKGDVAGVIAMSAKYGADENQLKADAQAAGIDLTKAQIGQTEAATRGQEIANEIAELTKDAVVRKAFADAGLAEAERKRAEETLPLILERYRIENRLLMQDEKLKELTARKAAVEARIAEATEQDQIERLRKENAQLDAQITLTLAQASATKAREALDRQAFDQNAQRFVQDTIDWTTNLIAKSPGAARDFIKQNKELFDKLGIDVKSFEDEIDLVERTRKAQDPVTRSALDAIIQAMPNPPKTEAEIETEAEKFRQMLEDTKLTPEEKEAWITTLKNAWWRVQQGMAIDLERIRRSASTAGVDDLDLLKEARQWYESERKTVEERIAAVLKEGEATGCIQVGPEDQIMLASIRPECKQTLRDTQARVAALRSRLRYLSEKQRQVGDRLSRMLGFGPTDNEIKAMFESQVDAVINSSGYVTPEDVMAIAKDLNIEMTRAEAEDYVLNKLGQKMGVGQPGGGRLGKINPSEVPPDQIGQRLEDFYRRGR